MARNITKKRSFWFVFLLLYFALGYLGINWITEQRESFFDVAIGLDGTIPFIPHFIFGYASVYIAMLALYAVLKDSIEFKKAAIAILLMTTMAYVVFILFPVKMMLRPDLSGLNGFSVLITKWFYKIDKPFNCFPSLHVAYPTMALLLTWRDHKFARWLFLTLFFIIVPSVLFVKQHYIADVIAGIAIAVLVKLLSV